MRRLNWIVVVFGGLLLAGCASSAPDAANDPFESANRAVYNLDEPFDKYVVLNLAGLYIRNVPRPLRRGVQNVLDNFSAPATFANDVLQGELGRAGVAAGRFALNSTVGLGGLFDIAAKNGLRQHMSDFGQTLSVYGVGEGPFLVLPIIGPEPPRDLVGDTVDLFLNPLAWLPPDAPLAQHIAVSAGLKITDHYMDHARDIFLRRELEKGSLDSYATMRSTYRQRRNNEIAGGKPTVDQ
jgi:phospholipid-binding lipoprotein MlaA